MGLLDSAKKYYKNNIPLQTRTFLESVLGNTDPITNEDFGNKNLQRTTDAIRSARSYRQGLLDIKNQGYEMTPQLEEQYQNFFPNEEAIKNFQAGGGTVVYDDYLNAEDIEGKQPLKGERVDWNFSDDAAVMNTLGKFAYKTNPDGTISVLDKYDFIKDPNFLGRKLMGDKSRDVNVTLPAESQVNLTPEQRENVLRNLIKQIELEKLQEQYNNAGR